MFQPCLFKNKSVVIYEVQEKFPSYTKPLLAPDRGRAGLTQSSAPAGKRRSGFCTGLFSSPVLAAGRKPRVPSRLIPVLPRVPGCGARAGAGRGPGRAPRAVLGKPQLRELPAAGCHSRLHSPKLRRRSVVAPPSSSPSSPRKTDGEHPGCPEGAFPVPERLCPCPGLAPGLSSAAPAQGTARCPSATRIAESRAALYLP